MPSPQVSAKTLTDLSRTQGGRAKRKYREAALISAGRVGSLTARCNLTLIRAECAKLRVSAQIVRVSR